MPDSTVNESRREIVGELSSLISIAQKIAQRLSDETHGDAYAGVNELNDTLHLARAQLDRVKVESGLIG